MSLMRSMIVTYPSPDQELADLARRALPQGAGLDRAGVGRRDRPADRGDAAEGVGVGQAGRRRRRLGEPVRVVEAAPREPLPELPDGLGRDRRAAVAEG